ncbi:pilus assembly protein N-terminal domain-containing protein [Jiella marina]|uniref:pilus assembly protein N-terminal domain-containing protein n=1 Tax=Jiella sp. LLJ827 TaxID=2917712 RepID=UPI002101C810|nr:pilus assembly protein N-terminal domain-containing protein [Jiella sp. LLJ827]MCQ0987178.1 pilus assembly protein N-terminal domain-containing protein [Jiella sp. LLJ827]
MSFRLVSLLPLTFALLAASTATQGAQAAGSMIEVEMDHAKVIELDTDASTVIVGNPAIVDVQVLSSNRLVLTGQSSGITNLLILGQDGKPVIDEQVIVQTFEGSTVRVYRQAARTTYACAPNCVPTVTVGDEPEAFGLAVQQQMQRRDMATQAANR